MGKNNNPWGGGGVLLLREVRPDLHGHLLHWVPGALPVHPHHSIIRAVLGHVPAVRPTPVVSAVGIGCVTPVIPPSATVFFRTLLSGICSFPERKCVWSYYNCSALKLILCEAHRGVLGARLLPSDSICKVTTMHQGLPVSYSKKGRQLGPCGKFINIHYIILKW